MAGENVQQYFSRDQETGKYFCSFCNKEYAKGTSPTRLRGHLTGERKTGARICSDVPTHVKESLSSESSNKRQKTLPGCIGSSSSSQQRKRPFEELQLPSQHQLEPPILGDQIAAEESNAELMQLDPEEQINKDAPLMENISNFPPGERGSLTEPTTGLVSHLVLPPNGSGANNYSGNQRQENQLGDDEFNDLLRELQYSPSFSLELNNDFGNQGGELQHTMSTHPNESGSVENLPLPNDTIGRTTQLQHQFSTEDLIQTPLEGQTNEASLMMEETPNFPLGGRATMASNESGSNLQPKALSSAADFMSQDVRNCRLTDQADQHEVRDEVTVQQDVQMLEGNQEAGESASRAKRPVGEAFVRNGKNIRSWLMGDQVLRVGIYGMGGVGKTTLMRHIQTLLEGQSSFKVYWITVSQDFSIRKLQDLIAKKFDLKFLDKEDEVERAAKLTKTFKAKGKCVLILDDLWDYFDIVGVGIPVEVNACKLVLTTRLLDVCRQMGCSEGNTIQLQRLSENEPWILFTQELGNYVPEVEELAKSISGECDGLPLGIRVMARTMKGIHEVHRWRNALEELRESKLSEGHKMREEVFPVLKFSYLRLNDPALQECLSYCALFPEIERDTLIECMIVEGIIDERKSRQAELDKGRTMLDTLVDACLLEGNTGFVWMHDLIRDMVILELREGSKTLVEAGAQLEELPDVERWTEKLVRVSLMNNNINEIPSSHTPRCPNLSTLLLCDNFRLKMIADSFFEQFQGLKVLDLSWCTGIEKLPGFISDLVNLTALLLRMCEKLTYVPSLEKLEKLKKLDLSGCEGLEEMPEGVKCLLNLKYLDVSKSGIEDIESGIIPMLSRLQVLKLIHKCDDKCYFAHYEVKESQLSIRGSEVGKLRMLETLHCKFSNVREFGEYMKSRERSQQSPSDYFIFIHRDCSDFPFSTYSRKCVTVNGDDFIDPLGLPTDIEGLEIDTCDSILYKRLFPPSLLASLLNLQKIRVANWGAIEEIFAMNEGENGEWVFPFSNYSTRSLSNHSLLNLKLIDIRECHKLKKLFPPSLLPNLHNLQQIAVIRCYGMEEIFSTDQEEDNHDPPNLTGLHLSKLTTLKLVCLPKLRSIYKGEIIGDSLREIQLLHCPKLQRITLPLPQPSLRRILVYPDGWWESVQWGSANDKNHLESFLVFEAY